jgi:hypothetical protein
MILFLILFCCSITFFKMETVTIVPILKCCLVQFRNDVKQSKLKEVAIIQLGYSRGGIHIHLPDDILHQIKEFVFYDIQKPEIRNKIATSLHFKFQQQVQKDFNISYFMTDKMYGVLEMQFIRIVDIISLKL